MREEELLVGAIEVDEVEVEEVQEELVHCIYTSVGTEPFSKEYIVDLLDKAKKKNAALGVTGMLLYDEGSFFQVLEGDPDAVSSLVKTIQKDERHDRVVKLILEPIEARDFSDWTMGYSDIKLDDLNQIEGMNDFFQSGSTFGDLDEGRTKKLLEGFKSGKWRTSLN